MSEHVSASRMREYFHYEDGHLFWRELSDPRRVDGPVGTPAGQAKAGGRRSQVQVPGDSRHRVAVYVHRAVWAWHHGEWPCGQVDHINGNPQDNRIENLRLVDQQANSQNVKHGGVSFDKRKVVRPWRARIMVNDRSISLGYYDTRDEAHAEYMRAKLVYHPAYASGVGRAA